MATKEMVNQSSSFDLAEVKKLVDNATSARNKAEAKPYIERLDFLQATADIKPYTRNVFGELIGFVKPASGRVKDKAHWLKGVKAWLYKLETSL